MGRFRFRGMQKRPPLMKKNIVVESNSYHQLSFSRDRVGINKHSPAQPRGGAGRASLPPFPSTSVFHPPFLPPTSMLRVTDTCCLGNVFAPMCVALVFVKFGSARAELELDALPR